jgi:hypothetical protein
VSFLGRASIGLEVEPYADLFITRTQPRDDIRIIGSGSSGLSTEDFDITTFSLAS